MSFWEVVWFIIIGFVFIAYLMLLFTILGDLLRDRETSGWAKAVWIVFLIFLPLLTSLVYLVVRGNDMARRQSEAVMAAKEQQDAYIRDVAGAGRSPAEEIAQAKSMLDSGAIDAADYERLKAKALGI
jgi:hypothetical protein